MHDCMHGNDRRKDITITWKGLRDLSVLYASGVATHMSRAESTLAKCTSEARSPAGDRIPVVALLAHRSLEWLATTVAILRCGLPFVWMGPGELPRKDWCMEASRNRAINEVLRPRLVIQGKGVPDDVVPDWPKTTRVNPYRIGIHDLAQTAPLQAALPFGPAGEVLCYMLTGGTTGASKCVEVTHRMALHEVQTYPQVAADLQADDVVLQHTPVLWAASTLGQINIALAFGATVCIGPSADLGIVKSRAVTVLGLVPSSLEALDPRSVPSVHHVFTWGEALPGNLGSQWRESGVRVLELLISTEYWLSFFREGEVSPSGQSLFNPVQGLDFAVLPQTSDVGENRDQEMLQRSQGAYGELCIRGAMVTNACSMRAAFGAAAGKNTSEDPTKSFWVEALDSTEPFLRTRDLVMLVGSQNSRQALQVEFHGRCDQLVKVSGQFVDLTHVERNLRSALTSSTLATGPPRELAAEIVFVAARQSDGRGVASGSAPVAAHAFVALPSGPGAGSAGTTSALQRARSALPRGIPLHLVVAPLPRDAVTRKVDGKALVGDLIAESPNLATWPALRSRVMALCCGVPAAVLIGIIDIPVLCRVLARLVRLLMGGRRAQTLALAYSVAQRHPRHRIVAPFPQIGIHLLSLPYLWLLSIEAPQHWSRKIGVYMPFGRLGLVSFLHHTARSDSVCRIPAISILLASTSAGLALAAKRSRVCPW